MKKIKIILVTGGSGGHVFPAIGLGEKLLSDDLSIDISYVCDYRAKKYFKGYSCCPVNYIFASVLKKSVLGIIKFVAYNILGFLQSLVIYLQKKPKVVVSFGGYASFPFSFVSKIFNCTLILYEQNIVLGQSNKYFANYAKYIFTNYDKNFMETTGYRKEWLDKLIHAGIPLRKDILSIMNKSFYPLFDNKQLKLLILGGSQGSSIFSYVVPQAVCSINCNLRNRFKIFHQCREEDIMKVSELYAKGGVDYTVNNFFPAIWDLLNDIDLIICRSGASTLGEISALGIPALLVPLPGSKDNHQLKNALYHNNYGGSWLREQKNFSSKFLKKFLESLLFSPNCLLFSSVKTKAIFIDKSVGFFYKKIFE